ncbi:MAG: cysteine desulfurase [Deltaproteobacteria bacterium]|nr:cysteine desulfurase [Deltaproteobacteria bacterium]
MTERDPIYLDHNATTSIHPEVVDAMLPFLRDHHGNPSSGHIFGQRAKSAVDRAREQVAALLGCDPDEVVFTSGGTESNNLAIRGVAAAIPDRRHILTSVVEHPATARPCNALEATGYSVTRLAVDANGRVRLDALPGDLRDDTLLFTIMLANNETGTIMPIAQIAAAARERGALTHSDAAQAVGKIPIDVRALGVDLLTVAGHKCYAPKGVGALYVRRGTPLRPFLLGAGHERGLRPGTENVPYIVALGYACEIAARDMERESARVRALRDDLWSRLWTAIPGIRLNGHETERLPNTLNVSFPGARGSAILAGAPEIAASTGSACHEGGESPSDVLLAQGLDTATALGAVRLTLGRGTTSAEIAEAAAALVRAFEHAAAGHASSE